MKNQSTNIRLSQVASQRLFAEKIAHYVQRQPKHFLQLEGVFEPRNIRPESAVDFEGDLLMATRTVELMNAPSVRVLIPAETHPKVAIRQLVKMTKLLRSKPELMEYAKPATEDLGCAMRNEFSEMDEMDEIPF